MKGAVPQPQIMSRIQHHGLDVDERLLLDVLDRGTVTDAMTDSEHGTWT